MSTTPIPIDQFASSLRTKYPGAYDKMSDADLVQAVVTKYPQYKDHVASYAPTQFEKDTLSNEKGGGITTKGMGTAAGETLSDQAKSLISPKNTLLNTVDPTQVRNLPQIGHEIKAGWERGGAPGTRFDTLSRLGEAVSSGLGSLVGMSGEKAAQHAAKGEGGAILGEAAVPAAEAIGTVGLHEAAPSIKSGLTAMKPHLESIAEGVTHPTQIPGRLLKAAVNQIPEKPTFPGASLPSADEFYKNRGEEINTIRERTEASKPGPELGSPENPGWHSKIPNTMPKAALPNIAPEQAGPPPQLPAGGSAQKLPTQFQKEVKPQIMKFPDLIDQATGVKPLRPDVPLKEQLTNQPPAPIEEVDPIKAKYPDPGVRQMVRANGERAYEAAKHDPVLVKGIHDLTRVELRQALVNAGEDMGQTTVSNSKFAGEGSIPREEAFNRLLDKGLTPEKIIELGKKTEGTANDRPQVKYKGGINEKGVEASTRQMSDKESISELENQIDTMSKTLKTSSRSAEEKAQLKQQIDEYQERLDELRGTAKR
jgi:hypothetical protein